MHKLKLFDSAFEENGFCGDSVTSEVLLQWRRVVLRLQGIRGRVDGDRLGAMVRFENPDQSISEFEHLRAQRDDNELSILGPLLKDKNAFTSSFLMILSSLSLLQLVLEWIFRSYLCV